MSDLEKIETPVILPEWK